mmetsp:Transcript_16569/g.42762  ORF Transcript_16569/g.42762 Transcript_16569/m.42762 type:complete len:372 (-) Transcript_16569:124-1239(-)|eukprot:CAMPEP_0183435516 /NCGR_PEP_ID=MMETSP0370-20130417/68638_1 /TAXON_ID=268820 /ORGANISM="Peridinium aciculiferum, Strain PAER-2" /LENGTH=371 /DNA_ID=CAMNT_0025622657 /DNA_START=63 /DNA_END=1178 /DNA_ORIENTATION=-
MAFGGILAATLVARGFKNVQPLNSASGSATIFRVQEDDGEGAEQYVAKVVSLISLDAKGRASAQQEVSLLKGLCAHPNLIAYRQSFMEEPGDLYIVMSLADGGDLRCVVVEGMAAKQHIPEPIICSWIRQTLSGIAHLHEQGVLHRDLKSSNIFLCNGRRQVRIGDFGISRVLDSTAFASSCVGTPAYMSPELMRNERYDYHVDMWALGCIVFELCTLRLPFAASSIVELACQVMDAEPAWSHWVGSDELQAIARRCLQKEAGLRPTAVLLLSEPLLAEGGLGALEPPSEVWACIRATPASLDDGDTSTSAESSAHLSRSEFADLLATHQPEVFAALQGRSTGSDGSTATVVRAAPAAREAGKRTVAETLM